jgi:hypothetical protein
MTLREPRKVARVYAILDTLNVHRHPNFKTIVFSDTTLVYNPDEFYSDEDREYLVWYLTEFAEDLHRRLTGQGIWFRAVLLAGKFDHYQLKNVECFYGDALIKAYEAEKVLPLIGLVMDKSVLPYNRYFQIEKFSGEFSFVYLSRQIRYINEFTNVFPTKHWEVSDMAPDLAFDIRFLADIYLLMRQHVSPAVRAKALTTWDFYNRKYPVMTAALVASKFNLSALGPNGAWAANEKAMNDDIRYFKRIGSGAHLSTSINKIKSKTSPSNTL